MSSKGLEFTGKSICSLSRSILEYIHNEATNTVSVLFTINDVLVHVRILIDNRTIPMLKYSNKYFKDLIV